LPMGRPKSMAHLDLNAKMGEKMGTNTANPNSTGAIGSGTCNQKREIISLKPQKGEMEHG
jgi:hypothetical protein